MINAPPVDLVDSRPVLGVLIAFSVQQHGISFIAFDEASLFKTLSIKNFAVRTGRRRSASGTKRVVKFISVAILIKAFKFLAASKITVIIISSTPMIAVVEFSLDHGVHIGSRDTGARRFRFGFDPFDVNVFNNAFNVIIGLRFFGLNRDLNGSRGALRYGFAFRHSLFSLF